MSSQRTPSHPHPHPIPTGQESGAPIRRTLDSLVQDTIATLELRPADRREAGALAAALREARHDALAGVLLDALERARLRSYQGHVDELRTLTSNAGPLTEMTARPLGACGARRAGPRSRRS